MTFYTTEQNLWLTAARQPVKFPADTRKAAERQKFTLLNMKRRWIRAGDPFANNCEFVEIIIRQDGSHGTWTCTMQPKGHRLHEMLASAGLNPDGTRGASAPEASPQEVPSCRLPKPVPIPEASAVDLLMADFNNYLADKYGSPISDEALEERHAWQMYGQPSLEEWRPIARKERQAVTVDDDRPPTPAPRLDTSSFYADLLRKRDAERDAECQPPTPAKTD